MAKKIIRNKQAATGPKGPTDDTNSQLKNPTKSANIITRTDLTRVVFDSLEPSAKPDKENLRNQLIR